MNFYACIMEYQYLLSQMSRTQADIDALPPTTLTNRHSITQWFLDLPLERALAILNRENPRPNELPRTNQLVDWAVVFEDTLSVQICRWLLDNKWALIRAHRQAQMQGTSSMTSITYEPSGSSQRADFSPEVPSSRHRAPSD